MKNKVISALFLSAIAVIGADPMGAAASENAGYDWAVQPTIEADDIYYLADYPNMQHALNTLSKQADNSRAVIEKDGQLGIIDLNGTMLTEFAYKEMADFGENYMMISTVPQYSENYGDWDIYWLAPDGTITADVGNGALDFSLYYYYQGSRQRAGSGPEEEQEIIPVQESSSYIDYPTSDFLRELDNSRYALDNNGSLVTDFIYDECGSLSDGLFAVCQDGKWGYVNEQGTVVIPLEYDASWKEYPIFNMSTSRSTNNVKDYCYAASDGYVVLCKGDAWELRDTNGNVVIPEGEFEALRPVFDGRCWAKKDGKWGVIEVNGTGVVQEITVIPTDGSITGYPQYDEIIRKYYKAVSLHWSMGDYAGSGLDYLASSVEDTSGIGYYISDLDQNGTEELLIGPIGIGGNYTGMFFDLYTLKDGNLVQVITSGERDRYYLCVDNTIANEGAGSAWISGWTYYDLVDGELVMREHVLADGAYDSENPWFYSTTEEWEDHSSPILEDAAQSIINSYQYVDDPYIPLSVLDGAVSGLDNQIDGVSELKQRALNELSVVEQESAAIQEELDNDASLTEEEYNEKLRQQCYLWNAELDVVWSYLEKTLSAEDMETLTQNQGEWQMNIDDSVNKVNAEESDKAAGILALEMTKDRVYELMDRLA